MSVVIVGGSVAGISTARALRDHGYRGAVTVLEAEHRPPYDKPPLSKEMLSAPCPQPVPLLTSEELVTLDIDLRLGVTATGLEPARKVVCTTSGEVGYSTLVVATGSRPRTLSGAEVLTGVYTLRCADDAVAHARRLQSCCAACSVPRSSVRPTRAPPRSNCSSTVSKAR